MIVDALATGRQTLILRKGGIAEGAGGFTMEHDRFLLMPTRFHQQGDFIIPDERPRVDRVMRELPPEDTLRISSIAEVTTAVELVTPRQIAELASFHIWNPETITERFEWGGERKIWAIVVRVSQLPTPVEIPMLPGYGGCRSWIELASDIDVSSAKPVIGDQAFETQRAAIDAILPAAQSRS